MATGKQAFTGSSNALVFDAILNRNPPPASQINPQIPGDLERIINRSLEKDPDFRYQSASDMKADLRLLKRNLDPGRSATVTAHQAAVASGTQPVSPAMNSTEAKASSINWNLLLPLLLFFVATIGFIVWRASRATAPANQLLQSSFLHITDLPGKEAQPTISPDGNFVAYVSNAAGNDDIYLLRVGGTNPINLTAGSPLGDLEPAFSPDGSRIAFRSERQGGGIFLMGATGESVKRLTDTGFHPSWSPDGKEIFYSINSIESDIWLMTLN